MKHRKLRRLGILALVLVLLFNTIGAQASTGGVTVNSYEELVEAIKQADDMDVITIGSFFVIPKGSTLGNSMKKVIIKYGSGAHIECELDTSCSTTTTFENLIFDGDGKVSEYPLILARGKVEFINCTFQRANYGAVRTAYTECSFTGCIFSNNLGKYYGGHINASIKSNIIVDNCTFSYGTSSSRGGAIHIDDADSSIHIKDSKISANESGLGGGISCSGALILEDTVIYNNHASTGGADLFIIGSYQIPSIEEMKEAYHAEGLEPVSWESDYTDVDYGGTCLKLSYEAYTAPTDPTPTEPETSPSDGDEEKEPSTGDNTEETEPPSEGGDEKEPTGGNEGGDNEEPSISTPEDPTIPDEGEQTPTEPAQPDSPQEPEDTEPTTPSTPSDAESTGGGDTVDNSNHSTTDNSQTNTDNSQSTHSVDNSLHESNDNSSYREDNSYRDSSSSTVNNYYQQESPTQESTASQNGSQPINITVPVEVSASQGKEAHTGSIEAPEGQTVTNSLQQNIRIEAESVDLVYEYTENGVNISIKAPESPTETVEAMAVNSSSTPTETPQRANKSPNWVENEEGLSAPPLTFPPEWR